MLKYYKIDPCYTFSTPGLTWICGLKYTNVRLKYYKENTINIYDTVQHGIRGGLASVLGECHVKCMNKEMNPEYTGNENYLKYLVFNSLYASALVQALLVRSKYMIFSIQELAYQNILDLALILDIFIPLI